MKQELDFVLPLAEPDSVPETDSFLTRFHNRRLERQLRVTRRLSAVQAALVVMVVGMLAVGTLSPEASEDQSYALLWDELGYSDSTALQLDYSIASYLLDESDDIYSTLEVYAALNQEPLFNSTEEPHEHE